MSEWQDISTAPRDGTRIDLWGKFGRATDCYWGKPYHCCGEAGRHCDSEWHGMAHGWVCGTFNHTLEEDFTHWMSLPAPPAAMKDGG